MSITIREELEARHVLISNEAYSLALASAKENSLELLESLIESEAVPKDVACHLWSNRLGRAYVNPLSTIISNEAIACLPIEIARKGNVMPLYVVEDGLTVAMPDPDDEVLVRRLAAISGKQISPVFCLSNEVRDAIELHYSTDQSVQELIAQLERSQGTILAKLNPEDLEGMGGPSRSSACVMRYCIWQLRSEPRIFISNR